MVGNLTLFARLAGLRGAALRRRVHDHHRHAAVVDRVPDLRAAIRRHPNALPVLSTRPARVPAMLGYGEHALGLLTAAGFTTHQAVDIVNCLGTFTIGHVLAEVGEPVGGATATDEELASLVSDAQYELGLRAMRDGFARLL